MRLLPILFVLYTLPLYCFSQSFSFPVDSFYRNAKGVLSLKKNAAADWKKHKYASTQIVKILSDTLPHPYALISPKGILVIPPSYDALDTFAHSKAYLASRIDAQGIPNRGIIDAKGAVLVPLLYRSIENPMQDTFRLQSFKTHKLFSPQSIDTLLLKYDTIIPQPNGYFLFQHLGQFGLINAKGQLLDQGTEVLYIHLKENYFLKSQQGAMQVLDSLGKPMLEQPYSSIEYDDKRYLQAFKRKGWKEVTDVYDTYSKRIILKDQDRVGKISENIIPLYKDSLRSWGYADSNGALIISYQYIQASPFRNGKALVRKVSDTLVSSINTQGEVLFRGREAQMNYLGLLEVRDCPAPQDSATPATELWMGVPPYRYPVLEPWHHGYIKTRNGKQIGLLRPDGKEVVYCYQDTLFAPSEDTCFLYKRADSTGFADKYGNSTLYITRRFQNVEALRNGLSRFTRDSLLGFIDPYGNVKIAPKYEHIQTFQESRTGAIINGKWGYIDKNENIIAQPYYDQVLPYTQGIGLVRQKNKWTLLNKDGEQINTSWYDSISRLENNHYLLFKNKKWGLATAGGKEALPPKYQYLEDSGFGYVKVIRDGLTGLMDYQENIIVKFTQGIDFAFDPKGKRIILMEQKKSVVYIGQGIGKKKK